jgi:hypothetical protein
VCWGEKVEYPNGKLAFSYICPVKELGYPKGYLSTKAGMREAARCAEEVDNLKSLKKTARPPSAQKTVTMPKQRPASGIAAARSTVKPGGFALRASNQGKPTEPLRDRYKEGISAKTA